MTSGHLRIYTTLTDVTEIDVSRSMVEASRLLLDMAPFEATELETLIAAATRLDPDDLSRLVAEVERWAEEAGDPEKGELRDTLRKQMTSRAYQVAADDTPLAVAFSRLEQVLEPTSATARHRWLFDSQDVEWSALVEEEDRDRLSWQAREARVLGRRTMAITEVEAESGPEAVLAFALDVQHPELVAQALVPAGAPANRAADWISRVLAHGDSGPARAFLAQILWTMGWGGDLAEAIEAFESKGALTNPEARGRLAKSLPGHAAGWTAAAKLGACEEAAYWNAVSIRVWQDTPAHEVQTAVSRLLEVGRPRSAFETAHRLPEMLPVSLWEQVLLTVVRVDEPDGPKPNAYTLERVFERLDGDPHLSEDRLALLELPFAPALCNYGHGTGARTLALHRALTRDPALLVQLLSWMYRRHDKASEPEFADMPEGRRRALYNIAYHTLAAWNTIPGMANDGTIDEAEFIAWNDAVARLSAEADRLKVSEVHVGALYARLARKRPWEDWLPRPVLDLLDRSDRGGLRNCFEIGVHNARGVTMRGPYDGGAQEWKLVERYQELAARYGNSHPRVAAMLIRIAEGYEWDAKQEDDQAALGERWHP